jgi:uncharacterized protein YdaU (DUF1376 family)
MSDRPFIKFYPSDFLAGTSGLSPAERGIYITLLCLIYENGGPIQRDEARLARRCGAPKAAFTKALEALIDCGKITDDGETLSNARAEKLLMDLSNRSQNAGIAANARWKAQKGKIQQIQGAENADAMPPQCVADAKPEARSQIYGGGGSACAREADFPAENPDRTERENLLVAMGHDPSGLTATGRLLGTEIDMAEAKRWAELGLTHELQVAVIREVMATKRDGPPNSFKFFRQPMQRAAAAMAEQPLQAINPLARGQPPTGQRQAIDVAAILAAIPDQD